jgi:nucleoid DNA-binding protein
MGLKSKTVSRTQLAKEIMNVLEIPVREEGEGRKILRIILEVMTKALWRGDSIKIEGFGTFKVKERPAGVSGHLFVTPEDFSPVPIAYPAKKRVVFTPSTALLAKLNEDDPNVDEARALATQKKLKEQGWI